MAHYGEHLRILVQAFLVLLGVFLVSSLFRWTEFLSPVSFSLLLLLLVILILSRFSGDLGRTQ